LVAKRRFALRTCGFTTTRRGSMASVADLRNSARWIGQVPVHVTEADQPRRA
jgi:hypothetical protein